MNLIVLILIGFLTLGFIYSLAVNTYYTHKLYNRTFTTILRIGIMGLLVYSYIVLIQRFSQGTADKNNLFIILVAYTAINYFLYRVTKRLKAKLTEEK